MIHSPAELVAPGVIVNSSPDRNRILVGEIDDTATPRIAALRAALAESGLESPMVDDIRREVWTKLISTLRRALLAFLTEQTSREVWDHEDLGPVVDALGGEGVAICAAHGMRCALGHEPPAAGHRSSILQDYDRGRPMEIDALLTAPLAFANIAGIAAPTIRTIAALVRAKSAAATIGGGDLRSRIAV